MPRMSFRASCAGSSGLILARFSPQNAPPFIGFLSVRYEPVGIPQDFHAVLFQNPFRPLQVGQKGVPGDKDGGFQIVIRDSPVLPEQENQELLQTPVHIVQRLFAQLGKQAVPQFFQLRGVLYRNPASPRGGSLELRARGVLQFPPDDVHIVSDGAQADALFPGEP